MQYRVDVRFDHAFPKYPRHNGGLCDVTTCVVCDVIGSRWSIDFDDSGWTDFVFIAFVEWSAFDDDINIKLNLVFCIIVLHCVSSKFYTLELHMQKLIVCQFSVQVSLLIVRFNILLRIMLFSRSYFSSGRAIGMVVVRLSVCPSVCNGRIMAKGYGAKEKFVHE